MLRWDKNGIWSLFILLEHKLDWQLISIVLLIYIY